VSLAHPKVGMDVEIRDTAGRWMIIAFGASRAVRVASLEWPGDVRWVGLGELREAWPPSYLSPIERLADAGR